VRNDLQSIYALNSTPRFGKNLLAPLFNPVAFLTKNPDNINRRQRGRESGVAFLQV
jgi:hypothetical protein